MKQAVILILSLLTMVLLSGYPVFGDTQGAMNTGSDLIALGKYEDALVEINHAIQIDPYNAENYIKLGFALSNLKQYDKATEAYDHALEIDPGNVVALNNKANNYKNQGKYDEALDTIDLAIESDSEYITAWATKGQISEKLGQYDEALKAYDMATTIKPKAIWVYPYKGKIYENLGQYTDALKIYDQMLEIDPNNAEAIILKEEVTNKINEDTKNTNALTSPDSIQAPWGEDTTESESNVENKPASASLPSISSDCCTVAWFQKNVDPGYTGTHTVTPDNPYEHSSQAAYLDGSLESYEDMLNQLITDYSIQDNTWKDSYWDSWYTLSQKTITTYPQSAVGWVMHGYYLKHIGKTDEGYKEYQKGIQLGYQSILEEGWDLVPAGTYKYSVDYQPISGSRDELPQEETKISSEDLNKIKEWIKNRKSVPYGWIIDEKKGVIYRDIYAGNDNPPSIPISWVLGTSEDPSKNVIFSTEVPEEKHNEYVTDIGEEINSDTDSVKTLKNWYDVSDENKRKTVKKIASYIQKELGLKETEIIFVSGPLVHPVTQEKVAGYYDQDKKTIIMSADPDGNDWKNDPKTIIDTLSHELKHRQQYEARDSMENDNARAATEANIASGGEYKLYTENDAYFYGQYIESDAYSFGDKMQKLIKDISS